MTTTVEQIKIMQGYVEGKRIEYYGPDTKYLWEFIHTPKFNWAEYAYRIAPIQPKPKTKLYAYLIKYENATTSYLALFTDPSITSPYHTRIPSEDKEIEL